MTRNALRSGAVTEDNLVFALMSARGDYFVAAAALGCTAREIDSYVRSSDSLRAFMVAMGSVKKDPEYERMSVEQFTEELAQITRAYQVEAVDVIHEMATMDYDSAAMAEVKLKAAIALRGTPDAGRAQPTQHAGELAELNRLYEEAAPRIRSVRAVQIEFDPSP
jgi:hypothetical protein